MRNLKKISMVMVALIAILLVVGGVVNAAGLTLKTTTDKRELEVGGELRKVFVEKLMNKYFPQFLSEYIESKNIEPKVIGIKQATKKGYIECELPGCADLSFPNSQYRRGRVQGNGQIVPTLTAAEGGIRYIESIYRIRKLTPRECFKLMGFTFEDWDK